MGPGDLSGKVLASLNRVASFVPVLNPFVIEPPGKPGIRELGILGWVGVVGEGSNPGLNGACIVNGAGLDEFPASPAVLGRLKGRSNPDAPFVDGSPEILGSL